MKYKAGIIGLGRIGFLFQFDKKREQPASHSNALYKNKQIIVKAGCDIDDNRLKRWHQTYKKASIYKNHKDMLNNESLDIIAIAVDEKNHLRVTLEAINSKPKLIILEKPVALNLKEAKAIQDLSIKKSVPIIINHERRYSKDYLLVKRLLDNNFIGEIHSVYSSLWSGLKIWYPGCEKKGDYGLIHDGTHIIDIINFLFDSLFLNSKLGNVNINKIRAQLKNKVDYINFTYENFNDKSNVLFNFELAGNKKYFGFDIDIRGNQGRIIIGNGYLKVFKRKKSRYYSNFFSLKKIKTIKRPLKTKYFSNMVKNCVNFLDKKETIQSSLTDGISALKIIESILQYF